MCKASETVERYLQTDIFDSNMKNLIAKNCMNKMEKWTKFQITYSYDKKMKYLFKWATQSLRTLRFSLYLEIS